MLSELWEPQFKGIFLHTVESEEPCFYINKSAVYPFVNEAPIGTTFPKEHNHIIFAPTPELAEELSQVIQGNWLPKAGDYYFCCGSSEKNYSFKGRQEIRRTEFNFTERTLKNIVIEPRQR